MWTRAIAIGAALAATPLASQDVSTQVDATTDVSASRKVAHAAIPVGAQIVLRTIEEVTSKTARKGDLVKLEVAEDYVADDRVVLTAGTPAVAELTVAEKKGWMGKAGKLEARMLYIELPTGPVRLSGQLGEAGQSNAGVSTVVTLVTGLGFITGKSAVIPAGTQLVAQLDREARIPVAVEPAT